jgi:hypothetical protein
VRFRLDDAFAALGAIQEAVTEMVSVTRETAGTLSVHLACSALCGAFLGRPVRRRPGEMIGFQLRTHGDRLLTHCSDKRSFPC